MNDIDVKITGLEGLENTFDRYIMSDAKIKRVLKETGEIVVESVKNNTPEKTGKSKRDTKCTVSNYDGELGCKIVANRFYDTFLDWGTSKSKKHVGYFEEAVNDVMGIVEEKIGGLVK